MLAINVLHVESSWPCGGCSAACGGKLEVVAPVADGCGASARITICVGGGSSGVVWASCVDAVRWCDSASSAEFG